MLYILLMLIMLVPAMAGFGGVTAKILKIKDLGLALILLNGIFFCTVSFTILAFFYPLNIYVEVITLLLGVSLFFHLKLYGQLWKFLSENALLFTSISFLIIFFGSYYPFILDHFGYYVPTIKWISEVGLVQGISNLDLLLGQMSFWHIFQAGFSNFTDPFLRINTLALIIYLIYILEKETWIHLVFLPFLFLFSQSPSPDLPVIAFGLIILNEVFKNNKNAAFLLALSAFVFAIKPTMIWLPLFVFGYAVLILKRELKFMLPAICVFILFAFKNIWTFGFPVFPVQFLDLGFSWKPAIKLLQNSSEMAIMKTYDMQFSYAHIQKFSTLDYIKNWFFLDGIKRAVHLLFILSVFVFLIYAVLRKNKLVWILFVCVFMKSIAVLLFSAQYRFFFDIFFVVVFILFYQQISKENSILIFNFLSIMMIGFLSSPNSYKEYIPSFKLGNFMTGFSKDQFIQPSYFQLEKYKSHQIGNLQFNIVDDYIFSFDTPLPAISPQYVQEDLDAGIFPQMKGKTLHEGFIWRRITPEEKEKIKMILKDFAAE